MSSGLVKNTDFASDLLLNKVMNGQYSANSGKSITMAGRINAANLDKNALTHGLEAENVRKGAVIADAIANSISEIGDIAKRAANINATMTGDALKESATKLKAELTQLLSLKLDDNTAMFGNTSGPTVELGQGAGSITLGVETTAGGIKTLSDALDTMASGSSATTLDKAQEMLLAQITNASAQAAFLENRYTSLNDLISSYKNASDDQVINAGGNSTSLLNNLIS